MLGSIVTNRVKKGLDALEGSLKSAFARLEPETPLQRQERERAVLHQRFMEALRADFEAVKGLEKEFSSLRHQLADEKTSIVITSSSIPLVRRPKGLRPELEKFGAMVEEAFGTNNALRFGAQGFEVVEKESLFGRDLRFTARARPLGFSDFVSFGLDSADLRAVLSGYGKAPASPTAPAPEANEI